MQVLICAVVSIALISLISLFAFAAPARLNSPLLEPVPSVVDNGDGTKTYTFFVLTCENGSTVSNLYENVVTTSSSNQLVFRVGQQNTVVNGVLQIGSNTVTHYLVSSGSVVEVSSFTPTDLGNYFHVNNANFTFRFRAGYFPKQSAGSTNCYIHAWCPEGVTFVNSAGAYYVDDWVGWAVDSSENIFYSHLDKPVQDQWNRFFIAYNRKTKEGILIHFNVCLNGIFQAMFDGAVSYASSSVSGDGYYTIPAYAIDLEGFYDSTGQYYQGAISPNQSGDVDIIFSVPASTGFISAELSQLVDGNAFSPLVDFSSGSETYKLYQPSLIYSNFGSQAVHYNVVVGIYNLLDGTLQNQYVFDSVLGNSNSVTLNIGTPISDIAATHIIDFGCLYYPNLASGFNLGSVVWSVDPVVVQWRSDITGKLDTIISLLQNSGADEPTTISRDLASGLASAEEALQPKDADGNPIDVAEEAQKVFDDSLDQLDELSPGVQLLQDSSDFLFERPIILLPVFVALTLGLLITIIGKNKSG